MKEINRLQKISRLSDRPADKRKRSRQSKVKHQLLMGVPMPMQ